MKPTLIVALDVAAPEALRRLVEHLAGLPVWYKIGQEYIYAHGTANLPFGAEKLKVDVKAADIGTTVGKATASLIGALGSPPALQTVFGLGGPHIFAAARAAVRQGGKGRPLILGITVPTDWDDADASRVLGFATTCAGQVRRLAPLVMAWGGDGIVCSPQESAEMRELLGDEAFIVTPGIRPSGSDAGGQKRVATPAAAAKAGANAVVVGRPITTAPNPRAAAEAILEELESATSR